MPWENATLIEDLNPLWPLGSDAKSEGDDHIRSLKTSIQGSFPNTSGPWNTTDPIGAGDPVNANHLVTKSYLEAQGIGRTAWGSINTQGVILASNGGFSVNKYASGSYRITFDLAADNFQRQIVVATVRMPSDIYQRDITIDPITETIVEVYIKDSTGSGADTGFHFQRVAL